MNEAIRVLHVDDDPDFADLAATYLCRASDRLDLDAADTADAAIARLDATDYDCIVSDHDMPGRDGIALLEAIRDDHPDLPFILYTGKGSEDVASRAISAGVTDYLQKDTGTDQFHLLANRIEHAVDQTRATRELAHRERKLEQLRERTKALAYTETVEETIALAVGAADEIIQAPLSGFHRLTEGGTLLEPTAVVDAVHAAFDELPRFERDAPAGSRAAFVWSVLEADEPVHVPSVSADDRIEEPTPTESLIIHPLAGRGVFIVSSPEPHVFTDTDRVLVEILVNDLEVALDRVEREQSLARLHEASIDLMHAGSPGAIADRIVRAATDILGHSLVVVRLYDADAGGLVPVAQSARVEAVLPGRQVFAPEGGSLNWEAYEAGEPASYPDIDAIERAVDRDTPIRSLLIVPIGEHGTISIAETESNALGSSDEHLAGLLAFAAETALATHEREAQLREQRDVLEQRNDQLDAFVRVVSHDLRSPLTAASGHLELAREAAPTARIDAAGAALERMETLIDDLLTLAKEGATIGDLEPVGLPDACEGCWRTTIAGGGDLIVESDATIRADASRFKQLLENLFRNAVEHGGDGVTVTVGDLEDGTGFYVADDGVGIPDEDRDAVLDLGHSVGEGGGTGFGLAIVNQIATAHGWEVTVTASAAGGARIEFGGVERVE